MALLVAPYRPGDSAPWSRLAVAREGAEVGQSLPEPLEAGGRTRLSLTNNGGFAQLGGGGGHSPERLHWALRAPWGWGAGTPSGISGDVAGFLCVGFSLDLHKPAGEARGGQNRCTDQTPPPRGLVAATVFCGDCREPYLHGSCRGRAQATFVDVPIQPNDVDLL